MPTSPASSDAYRPRAQLRIGVTGHRPGPKLPPETEPHLRASVERLFAALAQELAANAAAHADAFSSDPPQLVVISSLAEGADRIVADVGLKAGAVLDVVLPAGRADYETDFETPESKAEYRGLLARAGSVFELEATPGVLGGKRGYEAAGLIMMMAHSDAFDQHLGRGRSGRHRRCTGVIVEHAVNEELPGDGDQSGVAGYGAAAVDRRCAAAARQDAHRAESGTRRAGGDGGTWIQTLIAPPLEGVARSELDEFYAEPTGRYFTTAGRSIRCSWRRWACGRCGVRTSGRRRWITRLASAGAATSRATAATTA